MWFVLMYITVTKDTVYIKLFSFVSVLFSQEVNFDKRGVQVVNFFQFFPDLRHST